MEIKKITITEMLQRKKEGKKITMLTAYDYPMASFIEKSGIDIILVGDSAAMVVHGHQNTLPITMDEMLVHCRAVRRGAQGTFIVGDMPFLSYQTSIQDAILNAGRFLKEGFCDAVKIEGGMPVVPVLKAITDTGIPVMAHIGLTPQSATQLGGFKVQGKDSKDAQALVDSAIALQNAGAFCVLMECVPDRVAEFVTKKIILPTIGIGAGSGCDGQVLVTHDMLGLFERFVPKFAKKYVVLSEQIRKGIEVFKQEVEQGKFPSPEHSFTVADEVVKNLK
ncbi:3-methyl-2-oxobutanoate hydroxymethyltransferase [bacterium Unc6]|nr:3-methyl-2-oxobutanoate hydroxymethyltransferase [bacterium Unc6]